jgi:nicotinate-nucleotide pyrophosphorylase (carboxylating)
MKNIDTYIKEALREDAVFQDITSSALIPSRAVSRARVIAKEPAVVCGLNILKHVFKTCGRQTVCRLLVKDGAQVKKGQTLALLQGRTRALLCAERVALNVLGHLSGIATQTRRFVLAVKGTRCKVYDTRKTLPGLRALQKYAVRCGGGHNHRGDLNAMVLIKGNHLKAIAGSASITQAIALARRKTHRPLMIETETIAQFKEALRADAPMILLDNMTLRQIKKCVALKNEKKGRMPQLEASGNITLANIKGYAATGIDRISVGALTHTTRWADVSMEIL